MTKYKEGCGYLECIATDCGGCHTKVFDNKVQEPTFMDTIYVIGLRILEKIDDIHIIVIFATMVVLMFSLGVYLGWLVWGMM